MAHINTITIEGKITKLPKFTMVGAKQNFPKASFGIQSEGDVKPKKDGTTYQSKTRVSVSCGGKQLTEMCQGLQVDDIIIVTGELRVGTKNDEKTGLPIFFPSVEVVTLEKKQKPAKSPEEITFDDLGLPF
jgi:hypothetical protein